MELDHIEQRADGGPDEIANAIPVCFECHAEIHLYNTKHPRGRRFRPGELRLHKEQWLAICKDNPVAIIDSPRATDIGPLHSLIDELEFNQRVASVKEKNDLACLFEVQQFDRALHEGLVSILQPSVRDSLYQCYHQLKSANQCLLRFVHLQIHGSSGFALETAFPAVKKAEPLIVETLRLIGELLNEAGASRSS